MRERSRLFSLMTCGLNVLCLVVIVVLTHESSAASAGIWSTARAAALSAVSVPDDDSDSEDDDSGSDDSGSDDSGSDDSGSHDSGSDDSGSDDSGSHDSGSDDSDSDDSDSDGGGEPTIAQAVIGLSQASGAPGTLFQLEGSVPGMDATGLLFEWDLGDGTLAMGPVVDASYSAAGIYPIDLQVTSGGSLVALGGAVLSVIDPDQVVDLEGFPYPPLPGDADNDGAVTLADAQIVRQTLSDLVSLPDEQALERADFDLDRNLTESDFELLTDALLQPEGYPRRIVPAVAQPGAVITMYAPALLSPDGVVEVQIGDNPPTLPPRVLLGQIVFYLPLDVLTPGTFTEAGGQTAVSLLIDGVAVETFDLAVLPSDPVDPAAPLASISSAFAMSTAARENVVERLAEAAGTDVGPDVGLTTQDFDLISGIVTSMYESMNAAEADLLTLLQSLSIQQQEMLARVANANGLQDALSQLQAAASTGGGVAALDPSTFNIFCLLETSAAALDSASTAVGITCAALTVLTGVAIAIPIDGPLLDAAALFSAATACITYSAYIETANTILSYVPTIPDDLMLSADVDTDAMPTMATITARVKISTPVCDNVLPGQIVGPALDKIKKQIAKRILKSGPVWPIYQAIRQLPGGAADQVWMQAVNVVSQIIGQTPLESALNAIVQSICVNPGLLVPVDPNTVSTTLSPPVGQITVSGDNLIYTCPTDDPPDSVNLMASFLTCNGTATGSTQIACEGEVELSVTIGDNGNLTDDIFSCAIDGMTVVTMNAPTTSASGSIELSPGTYSLVMTGLAAPDGVGTYFVSISGGGATMSGPGGCGSSCTFATGTDLTAGTTLSWTLTVPSQAVSPAAARRSSPSEMEAPR